MFHVVLETHRKQYVSLNLGGKKNAYETEPLSTKVESDTLFMFVFISFLLTIYTEAKISSRFFKLQNDKLIAFVKMLKKYA